MKWRMSNWLQFSLKLALLLLPLFAAQAYYQQSQSYGILDFLILEAYLANYTLVVFSYGLLWILKKKYASSLGFLFLAGFFVKLLVFFIFFQPIYKADGQIESPEFLAFFIPYALCLFYETKSLVKHLNQA